MLDAVGLTTEQQAVYLALLDSSPATPGQIRDRVPGVRVRPAIAALESAGLISRLTGQPVRYQPAPPDMALEVLVRSREQELQQARLEIARLAERFRAGLDSVRPEEVVEVVTTRDATLQRWEQLQRSARHQVRSFDRPPYATDALVNRAEMDGLAAGISFRAVYARAGLDLPGRLAAMQQMVAAGEQARVTADLPVKMFLADNAIGLIPLERRDRADSADSALVIHSSSLLDTLSALFEAVWATAVPVRFGNGAGPAASKKLTTRGRPSAPEAPAPAGPASAGRPARGDAPAGAGAQVRSSGPAGTGPAGSAGSADAGAQAGSGGSAGTGPAATGPAGGDGPPGAESPAGGADTGPPEHGLAAAGLAGMSLAGDKTEVSADPDPAPGEGMVLGECSSQQRMLLGLLAVGLTDEAIGRQLGWHPRTVQRHVRRLMSELGAQTRFQAGLQAARRGWL